MKYLVYEVNGDVLLSVKTDDSLTLINNLNPSQLVEVDDIDMPSLDPSQLEINGGLVSLKAVEKTISDYKYDLSEIRSHKVSGGLVIDGVDIQTDERSINAMARKVTESVINGAIGVNWKKEDGTFKYYLIQDFKPVFKVVANYEEECFANEKSLSEALDQASDPSTVDLESGWPSTTISTK